MRKLLKRYLPSHDAVHGNRWLALFGTTLLHPRLWHLNRHSAAGAAALGMFCGLIPGPLQMLSAAIGCVVFRVNLPLALVCTLYTNPLTIVPLYFVAYTLGAWILGGNGYTFSEPPAFSDFGFFDWITAMGHWMTGLGPPLALGLLLLASLLAALAYGLVKGAWRWHLVRQWRRRRGPGS
ncbi:MAG: DUF2062 domain-containing protein [Zoogloeaceae bacterium]|nr:DUF2062 domain-containing protein [Zoogloeaceae bacterium]